MEFIDSIVLGPVSRPETHVKCAYCGTKRPVDVEACLHCGATKVEQ